MKFSQTFSILIWANPAKADSNGLLPLYARITVDGRRAEISLKNKVNPQKWNAKTGLMKGSTEEARLLNNYLSQVRAELFKHYNQRQLCEELLSADAIKLRFLGPKEQRRKTLREVFAYHNGQMEKRVGIDVVKATLTKFKTVEKKLAAFLQHYYQKSDCFLEELNHLFVVDFEYYLKAQEKIDHNTAMKYIRNLKKVINQTITNGWLVANPFQHFKCSFRKVEREILNREELLLLSEKEFAIRRLAEVRDIFLFCCYTGYAFVDVEKLTPDDMVIGVDGEKWIHVRRTKTQNRSNVLLLPQALALVEKYRNHPECQVKQRLLPVKSNQKMNAYLKEVADLCGIKKKLTMHIARHTFATTVTLANGVPIETVSAMLGHSSMKTTQIYAKVVERKVSEDMQALRNKLSKAPFPGELMKTGS